MKEEPEEMEVDENQNTAGFQDARISRRATHCSWTFSIILTQMISIAHPSYLTTGRRPRTSEAAAAPGTAPTTVLKVLTRLSGV